MVTYVILGFKERCTPRYADASLDNINIFTRSLPSSLFYFYFVIEVTNTNIVKHHTIFHILFLDIPLIQFECGEYLGILRKILSVPQNIVMNLNNVMTCEREPFPYNNRPSFQG